MPGASVLGEHELQEVDTSNNFASGKQRSEKDGKGGSPEAKEEGT